MKAAGTNAPMFAHATEALMSQLPTVKAKRPLPEPDSKLIGSLLIPYQSRDAVCVWTAALRQKRPFTENSAGQARRIRSAISARHPRDAR
jgi:hypothetical protein